MSRPRKPLRRRRVLLPAVLACLALVATGCSGDAEEGGEDGKITLRFSWWGSDTRHAATQQLIKLFEQSHPNVRIQPDYTGWGDYWDKLATSVAGGNAPDIMQQETRYVREYADRGALLDLNQFVPATIRNADLDPMVKDIGAVDGKLYAIPTGVNAFAMVADPGVFEAAKVEVPDDDAWTWDDLVTAAAAVTKGSPKGTYGVQNMGYVDVPLEIFARQRGQSIYAPDGGLGVQRDTLVDYWTLLTRMRTTGGEPPASLTVEVQSGGLDRSLLATGKGALGGWWTNELPALSTAAGKELRLLRMPGEAAQPGMFFKPAMFWSIGAKTKHPEEAAQFVDFLLNDPAAADILLSDRGLPVNLKTRERILPKLSAADQQSAQFMERIRPQVAAPPALPPKGAGQLQDILQQINEQVLFDRLSAEEAADEFIKQATAAIS